MGIYAKTIVKLEDNALCEKVAQALKKNYSRRYIESTYHVTRRTIDHIIKKTMN